MTNGFVLRPDAGCCALLAHIVATLAQYYTTPGITAATSLAQDATVYAYLCNRQTTLTQGRTGRLPRARPRPLWR